MVMKGPKKNGLYVLQGKTLDSKESALSLVCEDKSDLWHKRMGHIGNKGLKYFSDQNLLCKDSVTPLSFCETCVLGKLYKVSFGTGEHITKRPLDYIHANLWGPKKTSHTWRK